MELERTVWVLILGTAVLVGTILTGSVVAEYVGADPAGADANATELQFEEVSRDVGFRYNTSESSGVISDAGVYAADYDDDGWTDLLAIGAERPVLFDNEGGEFTASGHLEGVDRSMRSAVFLDYDADGSEDLVLFPRQGRPVVLHNEGGSLTRASGVLDANFSRPVGATVGDYDRDGCPDLFVVENGDWSGGLPAGHENASVTGAADNGNANRLFDGDCGSFTDVTDDAGITGTSWSLAASMVDLDRDGHPDIHVANDFNDDVVYWNDGDGTFTRQVLPEATNRNAMASEVEDFTGDGRLDLFVTNIHLPESVNGSLAFVADGRANGNNLLASAGERSFDPAGERCGVAEGGWGWAAVGADLDNDGDTDLFHTTLEFTGRLGTELLRARETSPAYSYPVLFERESGADCAFDTANASAAGFEVTDGHGAAQADFDRDGDVDIAMAISGGPTGDERYRLYENVGATGNALQVRVAGQPPTGATRVFVETDDGTQVRSHNSKTDYFSQDERVLHFGTGNHSTADVRVVWPDGTERTFEGVETGTRLVVTSEGVEQRVALDGPPDSWLAPGWLPPGLATATLLAAATVGALGTAVVGYRRFRAA